MIYEQLQKRLTDLSQEFEKGQAMLRESEEQQTRLREAMLRISGAIQVLEEEMAKVNGASPTGDSTMLSQIGTA